MKTWIWIALIVIGISVLGWGIYERYFASKNRVEDLQGDGQGAIRAAQRNYNWLNNTGTFSLPNGNTGILGYFDTGNNLVKNKYKPLLAGSADEFAASKRAANRNIIQNLVSSYDKYVVSLCQQLNIPRAVVYAVLAIETGKYHVTLPPPKTITSAAGALGPAQIKPITATDTVRVAIKKNLVSKDSAQAYLSKHIGAAKAAAVVKTTQLGDTIIGSELQNVQTALYVMVLKLAVLIDNYAGDSLDRLHLVLYCYNQGDYRLTSSKSPDYQLNKTAPTLAQFYTKAKASEGRSFLLKALGENGTLDIAINDLGITDGLGA